MRPLVLTPRGVFGTLAVLVVAGVCIRLGIWQLDRLEERQASSAAIAERLAREPVELDRAPVDTAGLAYRRARLTGPVDDERAIILAGRSRNGAPGVHILSPVRLGAGSVLVNRGWLPSPDAATVELDAVRLTGAIRAEGVLMPFPAVDREAEPGGFRDTWFRFDGDALRAQYPYPVAPVYLQAAATEAAAGSAATGDAGPGGPEAVMTPVALGPPSLDAGPHLSYAIQWFSFAAVFLIGWVVLLARRPDAAAED